MAPEPLNISTPPVSAAGPAAPVLDEAAEEGRVDTAELTELISILSLSAIVAIGIGAAGVGST